MASQGTAEEFAGARRLLLGWLYFAVNTPRRRSQIEVSPENTFRYLQLEAAWCLHRLRDSLTADEMANRAIAELLMRSRVEQGLAISYQEALSLARAGAAPPEQPTTLVMATARELAGLSQLRFDQYRFVRAFDGSYALSPLTQPDAIAMVYKGPRNAWPRRPVLPTEITSLESVSKLIADTLPGHWWQIAPTIIGQATGGLSRVEALLGLLTAYWPSVTDSFNTNEYYCYAMINVFSTMAFAIAQAVNPIPLLDSPPAAMS